MRRVIVVMLFVLAAAPEARQAPQAPQPQVPIFKAGTDLVRVDVTVTQRGDEPVSDLKIEDFELFEDDQPQTVETLKFIQVDGTRTSDLNEPLEIRSREHAMLEAAREDVRLFGIFLD